MVTIWLSGLSIVVTLVNNSAPGFAHVSCGVTIMFWRNFGTIGAMLLMCLAGYGADVDVPAIQRADALMAQHQFEGARLLYERALTSGAQFENDVVHARNLALACLNSTPPDLANGIKWLRIAQRLDPNSESLQAKLAESLLRIGDPDGAIEYYRVMAEAHPQSAEHVIALATALRQAGKSEDAIQILQATTERFPNLIPVRIEYARLLSFSKQFSEAKRQFSTVLAADPENVIAQVGMAKAISFQGDQTTSLEMYNRLLERYPGLYDAKIGKAFSLLWSGHAQQARSLLEEGLAQHPEDREVREALAGLRGPSVEKQQSMALTRAAKSSSPRRSAILPKSHRVDALAEPSMSASPATVAASNQDGEQASSNAFSLVITCLAFALVAGALSLLVRFRGTLRNVHQELSGQTLQGVVGAHEPSEGAREQVKSGAAKYGGSVCSPGVAKDHP